MQKLGERPSVATGTERAGRILVVDDSLAQAQALSMMLRRWGFDVKQAYSGQAALALCQTWAPDVIVSDWMMPEMSGLDFCRAFRALPDQGYAYFILLTAKNTTAELALGLDAGADDFTTKPVNSTELRARINAGARIAAMQKELSTKNAQISKVIKELQDAHHRIDTDLRQARKIQQALVPTRHQSFGRVNVSLMLHPCGHVGGDMSGMFSPDGQTLGFYNIDVSGHGITSAMMIARVTGYLSPHFLAENLALRRQDEGRYALRSPEEIASILNKRLLRDAGVVEYLTMAFGALDIETGRVALVQAGHPPPLLLRADGTAGFLGNGGMPVGLMDGADYCKIEAQLHPGDRLLLYSDGFSECIMKNGEQLGEDGFLDMVQRIPEGTKGIEFLDDLYWSLMEGSVQSDETEDDVSATLVEMAA